MRIACAGYRSWALNIYDNLANATDDIYLIFRNRAQFCETALEDFEPDLVLFYGWSWMVSEEIVSRYKCLMLHPSPLPRYRGGSPIQNQIIAGETDSRVTIFQMNSDLDAGPILQSCALDLTGSLNQIFSRIEEAGVELTLNILKGQFKALEQNHAEATYCKRRGTEESEITQEELKSATALYLYNKIRMLSDPYPNAYIRCGDGAKLYIKLAECD